MSELTDYEKAMLIMQRAQVRLAYLSACQGSDAAELAAGESMRNMVEHLQRECSAEVLYIVSPRPADPPGYFNG